VQLHAPPSSLALPAAALTPSVARSNARSSSSAMQEEGGGTSVGHAQACASTAPLLLPTGATLAAATLSP
jgi:hypothetical protein